MAAHTRSLASCRKWPLAQAQPRQHRPRQMIGRPCAYISPPNMDGAMEPMELYASIKLCPHDARTQIVRTVERFYLEVWNNCSLDLLEDLVTDDVVYRDLLFRYDDFVGLRRLHNVIAHYLRAYPDLRYTLDDIAVDVDKQLAMVHWHARGSCLRDVPGTPATGRVNRVSGMAKLALAPDGRICRVHCYRQPFHEELHALEEVQPEEDFL